MAYSDFEKNFIADGPVQSGAALRVGQGGRIGSAPVAEFLAAYGGRSFNGGVYRTLPLDQAPAWTAVVTDAFPEFRGGVSCFGIDWLGRTFGALDKSADPAKPDVLLFEPGSGEALEVDSSLQTFHDFDLVQTPDDMLELDFYEDWLKSGGARPTLNQCVSWKIPLFLKGKDRVDNLEICDLDVYWTICGQLLERARRPRR